MAESKPKRISSLQKACFEDLKFAETMAIEISAIIVNYDKNRNRTPKNRRNRIDKFTVEIL